MISGLKCDDLIKPFYDVIDETPTFIRREACGHYEIKIKMISKDAKFQKFIIKFTCKKCKFSSEKTLEGDKRKLEYQCRKCTSCKIIFLYEYIKTNDRKEIDSKMSDIKKELENQNPKEEEYNDFEYNIDNIDSEPPPARGFNYNSQPTSNNKENQNSVVNKDQQIEKENIKTMEKVYQTSKVYHTPNETNNGKSKLENSNNINKKKEKIYYTPENKENSKINPKMIKIKIIKDEQVAWFEFNPSETIISQYKKIQETFNFTEFKPLIFNSVNTDFNKTFKENQIFNGDVLVIE
jgi:hypothetical protein